MTAEVHNPDRYMADLRAVLAHGRKRIGILIGAGAAFGVKVSKMSGAVADDGEPLIPHVQLLTEKVFAELDGADRKIIDALTPHIPAPVNIEGILSRIRTLATVLGTHTVEGSDGPGYAKLAERICARIGEHVKVRLPKGPSPYTQLAAWIGGVDREHAVEIFTPNYDLLLEEALERAGIPYFDGFSGGSQPFFDPATVSDDRLPSRWARVWKLHGSLGWAEVEGKLTRGMGREASHLIYPDHLKYGVTHKYPYSALFDRLTNFLRTPDTILVTCGFSFADPHISAILEEALTAHPGSAVVALQFQPLAKEEAVTAMAERRANLSVYAEDGAVIRASAGAWQPGPLPGEEWREIRASYWGVRSEGKKPVFTLGAFDQFTRFCSQAQAERITAAVAPAAVAPPAPPTSAPAPETVKT